MTQWTPGSNAGVLTMSRTELPRARTSPQDVRRKRFSARLRGVDNGEVRSFLTGLADELEGLHAQLATLTQENVRLSAELQEARADLEEAQASPMEHATELSSGLVRLPQSLSPSSRTRSSWGPPRATRSRPLRAGRRRPPQVPRHPDAAWLARCGRALLAPVAACPEPDRPGHARWRPLVVGGLRNCKSDWLSWNHTNPGLAPVGERDRFHNF